MTGKCDSGKSRFTIIATKAAMSTVLSAMAAAVGKLAMPALTIGRAGRGGRPRPPANQAKRYLVYGRIPLFCSRRYLLSNYFKYINKNYNKGNYYIKNKDNKLYISEEDNATIIYGDIVNLINEDTSLIDYKVLDFNNIDNLITYCKKCHMYKVHNFGNDEC